MVSTHLAKFRAVYCSGAFVSDADAVTALSLFFEKVHLPNNIEMVRSFVAKYRPAALPERMRHISVTTRSDENEDPFSDLPPAQQEAVG
jgi:hypothetical protein